MIEDRATGALTTEPAFAVFAFIGADAQDRVAAAADHPRRAGLRVHRPRRDGPRCAARGHWPLRRDPFLLETSVPGVFAAGDVRHGSVKRVASGVGEGSMAIAFIHQYLATQPVREPALA